MTARTREFLLFAFAFVGAVSALSAAFVVAAWLS